MKEAQMTAPTRQTLLTRGWYVASEVELAFMRLSGRAHDLLIILKHLQGGKEESFPSRERLADVMQVSVRTVQNLLNELCHKGALTSRRTGRSSRYAATYVRATVAELRLLMGGELEIPDELTVAEVQDPCTSEVQDSGSPLLYKEPPTKNQKSPSLREGADGTQEAVMGMRGIRPHGVIVDEFDPVAATGLWESQELPEDASDGPQDSDGPDPSPSVRTAPRRAGKTQAQLDSPMALALELDRQIRAADWDGGPAPVNAAALARNISVWKRNGTTADQIRSMIERYVNDASLRREGKAPWIDFIGSRYKLLALVARATQAQATEDARYADDSHWLGSMAGER